jgi:hypothetical protein
MAALRTCMVIAVSWLVAPAAARADGPAPELHVTAGVEIEGDGRITSVGFRGQALVGTQLGSGRVRPSIAAGVVVGAGALYVEDPRAATGSVAVDFWGVGPILQLGLHLRDSDDHEAAYVFASAAHLRTSADARLRLDAVPGVTGGTGDGMRASLGANWAHRVDHYADAATGDALKTAGVAALLLLVLPQQLEVTVERDAGSTRKGVTLSWGF